MADFFKDFMALVSLVAFGGVSLTYFDLLSRVI